MLSSSCRVFVKEIPRRKVIVSREEMVHGFLMNKGEDNILFERANHDYNQISIRFASDGRNGFAHFGSEG